MASGTYKPLNPASAQRSPKSTSSKYDSNLSSKSPTRSNNPARNTVAVNGANCMVLGWFHMGESRRPCPQRQAQPPRQTASNEPSINSGVFEFKSLPVANQASLSSSSAIKHASQ